MFTGKLPFNGSLDEIIGAQITQNFISPSVLNPQIPPAIERIILKALAPNPKDRYQDVTSLKYDLENAMTLAQKTKPAKFSFKLEFGIPLWILYLILGIVILLGVGITVYVQMNITK
jgi:serine/threonine protein kinase